MVSERVLDRVDAAVALALVLGLVVLPVPFTMLVGALVLLLAPGVLAATALSRSPRDRVQASLGVATYVALVGVGVGLEFGGPYEDLAVLSAAFAPVLAVALAVRCSLRLRDGSENGPVGVGKGRVPGVGDSVPDVVGAVRPTGDGPVVFPDRPRRRAAVLRLTLVPFALVPLGALLLAAVVASAEPSNLPPIQDEGTRAVALLALLPALLHGGNVLARAGIARWRGDRGDVDRDELRWALAHGAAWLGFWVAANVEGRALAALAAVAVAGTAVWLALASVGAVRDAADERRSAAA